MSDDASDPIEDFFKELGFVKEKCPYCHCRLYKGEISPTCLICLNGCLLPGYLYRILNGAPTPPEPSPDPDPYIGEQV